MNELSEDKQTLVLYLLGNGESVRQVERITGVHRNTITRLMRQTMERQDRERRTGRPPLGEKGKSNIVPIRVTEEEYRKFKAQAKREGCESLSAWIRRTTLREARRILREEANPQESISMQV